MASGARQRGGRPRRRGGNGRRRRPRGSDGRLHVTTTELATAFAEGALSDTSAITGAMECEHHASYLAAMWDWARPVIGAEKANAIGGSVVEILSRSTDIHGLALLRGLAAVAEAPVSELAYAVAAEARTEHPRPDWFHDVGAAAVGGAVRVGDLVGDDGSTVLLDLRWPDGQHGGVGVFIDPRLDGCAKHILVGPTLSDAIEGLAHVETDGQVDDQLQLEEAIELVEGAMGVSDRVRHGELGETYAPSRGFVKRQLRNARLAVPRNRAA